MMKLMNCEQILYLLLLVFFGSTLTIGQLISPCPRLFIYETNNTETDRWYGRVTLLSDSHLEGVWLRLIFDKPSIQLGNWFGEVVTQDNKEYLIKNRNVMLQPNVPQSLRFYIKYNPAETPPQLMRFRLNAKTVCPENGVVTTEATINNGEPITSTLLSTTSKPLPVFGGLGGGTVVRPGGGFDINRPTTNGEEDYFQGDFSALHKPQKPFGDFDAACGTVVVPPKPLITHGQATHEGEFPWHIALYHSRGIDLTYICGGSLVSKYHVITVAHCVTKRKSNEVLNPETLLVYLGKYYLKLWSSPAIQQIKVHSINIHQKYNPQTFTNDIAIIRLGQAVEITDYVRPVCLWEGDLNLQSVINKVGTVVGWGYDETGKVTDELTKAKMPIVSQETCIYSYPDFFSRFTSANTFCAGFKNGTSVCNGDSGGGMVFPKQIANTKNIVWQLRGLVSISVALQNQFKCDATHYVVFTDLAKYIDWIHSVLN